MFSEDDRSQKIRWTEVGGLLFVGGRGTMKEGGWGGKAVRFICGKLGEANGTDTCQAVFEGWCLGGG